MLKIEKETENIRNAVLNANFYKYCKIVEGHKGKVSNI